MGKSERQDCVILQSIFFNESLHEKTTGDLRFKANIFSASFHTQNLEERPPDICAHVQKRSRLAFQGSRIYSIQCRFNRFSALLQCEFVYKEVRRRYSEPPSRIWFLCDSRQRTANFRNTADTPIDHSLVDETTQRRSDTKLNSNHSERDYFLNGISVTSSRPAPWPCSIRDDRNLTQSKPSPAQSNTGSLSPACPRLQRPAPHHRAR